MQRKRPKRFVAIYPKVISLSQCYEWYSRLRSGDIMLHDLPKRGRVSVVDNGALNDLAESDPNHTIEDLAIAIGCGKTI